MTAGAAAPSLGLPPRPGPDPAVVAIVTVAVLALGAAAADPGTPPGDEAGLVAWRFSGRWWTKPALLRRVRPSAG